MMHITIPKPCHEDWNKMTLNEQGRHCNVCCKTVVDFTTMNDEEIKYFFINKKKEESVCGLFKNEQLHRIKIQLPYNIYQLSMPLWKRFLTACLLAFSSMLFSCDTLVGKTETVGITLLHVNVVDSTSLQLPPPPVPQVSVGELLIQADTSFKFLPPCTELKGDIQIVETITQGMSVIELVESGNDTPLMGEPAISAPDTSQSILPQNNITDSTKLFNHSDVDSFNIKKNVSECDNDKFINL